MMDSITKKSHTRSFKITKNSSSYSKRVKLDKRIGESFHNTTVINSALRAPRNPSGKGLLRLKTAGKTRLKELMLTNSDFKDTYETEQQKLNKLKEEVKALPSVLKPKPNPRTYKMIMDQKRRRRMAHINEMHEFEKDIQQFKETSQEKIKAMKQDVEGYEEMMNNLVSTYLQNLSPEHLLEREIDILDEIDGFALDMEKKYVKKLDNTDKYLDDFEDEFYESIQDNVDNLREALIEIAFKLEPEINELIEEIRGSFKSDIEHNKTSNKAYYEEMVARIHSKIEEVKQKAEAKKEEWKKIKHDFLIKEFKRDVNKDEFRDPVERKKCLTKLGDYMLQCFEERKNKLHAMDEMAPNELSKGRINSYLEAVREINDKAQEGYDSYVEQLIQIKKDTLENLRSYLEFIKEKVKHYGADLGAMTQEELFEQAIEPEYTKADENQTTVIQEVIDFMEERDKIQNNVCTNLGNDLMKFGARMEKYIHDQTETEKKYEYEKAILEDEDDEKLEKLTTGLDAAKAALRRSVQHEVLDQNLQVCFKHIDDIDAEFRDFHKQNLEVIKKHAPFIEDMFKMLENDFANLMDLKPLEEREALEERAVKITKWKAKLKTEKLIKEEEEKAEKELQALIEKNKDNKKFKPPKVKPKTEKQKAEEYKQLFEKHYQELLVTVVQIDDIGTGNARLIGRSVEAFTRGLYQPIPDELSEEEIQRKKEEEEKKRLEEEEEQRRLEEEAEHNNKKKKKPVGGAKKKGEEEEEIEEIADPEDVKMHEMEHALPGYRTTTPANNSPIFESEYHFEYDFMLAVVKNFREKIFDYLAKKRKEVLHIAELSDKEFIEMSLTLLDERIKRYYSMKGKIQTEIYLIRSGEITRHKRRYEIYIKTVLDELDDQTDRFNFFYQEVFDEKNNQTEKMKGFVKELPHQAALTNLQGVNNKAMESDNKFLKLCQRSFESMSRLSDEELKELTKQNEDMLASWKLIEEGGNYSETEIAWYREMMSEIQTKIENHRENRKKILEEITAMCEKRRTDALKKFKEAYELAVDELTARDATGKVFGRPKREGQKIVRTEFAICTKTETYLKSVLSDFEEIISSGYIGSLSLRAKLMSFRACCYFYGRYLEAFKEESPLSEHPRVTYKEDKFGVDLGMDEAEDDNERQIEELKPLQRLYYRGEEIRFSQKIDEMERVIKEETLKLYTGDYAKLLGNDKLTDVLRNFIESLKMEMGDFRINAIRQLRIMTDRLIELSPELNRILISSIFKQDRGKMDQQVRHINKLWDDFSGQSIELREQHVQRLRPNLAHPDNAEELEELNKKEAERSQKLLELTEKHQKEVAELYFTDSNKFFFRIFNNFAFLLKFYDNWILHEDYVLLPGDENSQRRHLNLKKLMIKDKRGELTDTTSMRSIKKKWKMYKLDIFSYEDFVYDFDKVKEDPKAKAAPTGGKGRGGKKASKKAGKKAAGKGGGGAGGKDDEVKAVKVDGMTPPLVSFKTLMQKSAFLNFDHSLMEFKNRFDAELREMDEGCDKLRMSEQHFNFYWETTNRRLFDDSL